MIHPDLPGIEVTVCVGGKPLLEYATDNEPIPMPKQATKWAKKKALHHQKVALTKYIEVVEGQNFIIKVKAEAPYRLDCPKIQFRVEVDGDWIREPIMTKEDYKDKAWEDVVEGPCGDVNSSHRPMTFSAIKTTSDKITNYEIAEHKDKMEEVGEIRVGVHRREEGEPSKPSKREVTQDFKVSYDGEPVHEKATVLSATSHRTTYDSTMVSGKEEYKLDVWKTKSVDGNAFPRALFIFKYRSREALKQLLVIPRASSPEPGYNALEGFIRQEVRDEDQDPIQEQVQKPIQKPIQEQVQKPIQNPLQEPAQEPAPVQVNPDEGNLTPEEKRVMARAAAMASAMALQELRSSKGNNLNLKREREREHDGVPKQEHHNEHKIKREHLSSGAPGPRKKPKKWTGKTIIDLTESDTEPDYD